MAYTKSPIIIAEPKRKYELVFENGKFVAVRYRYPKSIGGVVCFSKAIADLLNRPPEYIEE